MWKKIVIGGACVAAVGVGATLVYRWAKSKKVRRVKPARDAREKRWDMTDPAPSDDKPKEKIPKAKLIAFFAELAGEMQSLVAQLGQVESQLRQANVPDETLREELKNKYTEALPLVEEALQKKHGLTKADISKAGIEYKDDAEFQAAIAAVREIDSAVMEAPAEVPEWLTLDKLLAILTEMMRSVSSNVVSLLKEMTQSEAKTMDADKITVLITERQSQVRAAVFKKYNITQAILGGAFAKYQNEPSFQETLQKLQLEQAAALQPFMGGPDS